MLDTASEFGAVRSTRPGLSLSEISWRFTIRSPRSFGLGCTLWVTCSTDAPVADRTSFKYGDEVVTRVSSSRALIGSSSRMNLGAEDDCSGQSKALAFASREATRPTVKQLFDANKLSLLQELAVREPLPSPRTRNGKPIWSRTRIEAKMAPSWGT